MPLVPAKCPSCGGDMQIDGSRKEAFCPYCGSKFLVESAVNYYNTKNEYHIEHADIRVEDSKGLEARLASAETYLDQFRDFEKAAELFTTITENHAGDWRGWWGLLRARTGDFDEFILRAAGIPSEYVLSKRISREKYGECIYSIAPVAMPSYDWQSRRLYMMLESIIDRVLTVAPAEKRDELEQTWNDYLDKVVRCMEAMGLFELQRKCNEIHMQYTQLQRLKDELEDQLKNAVFRGGIKKRLASVSDEMSLVGREADEVYDEIEERLGRVPTSFHISKILK